MKVIDTVDQDAPDEQVDKGQVGPDIGVQHSEQSVHVWTVKVLVDIGHRYPVIDNNIHKIPVSVQHPDDIDGNGEYFIETVQRIGCVL